MRNQRSASSFDRRLIGMGVLALIAIGLFLAIQFVEFGGAEDEEDSADSLPPAEEPLFPDAGAVATVTGISIVDNETGDTFVAASDEDGVWTIEEAAEESDTGLGVDEPRLSGALIALPSLTPTRTLSEVEVVATYGLSAPAYTIIFDVHEAGTYTMEVGSLNPDGTAYYVQVPGRANTVYLVSNFNLDPLIEFVTDPPYIQPVEGEGTPEGEDADS